MKNITIAVCDISPESQASCEHSRSSVGMDVKLCAFKDSCPNKKILKEFQRVRKSSTVVNTELAPS